VHFLGVSGLTGSCILYDYTASGHKGITEYVCSVYFYIKCTYISIQYIYLFMVY